ncbi:MAG: hypothetical protein AABZ33_07930 [Chloroflexota bacterium]
MSAAPPFLARGGPPATPKKSSRRKWLLYGGIGILILAAVGSLTNDPAPPGTGAATQTPSLRPNRTSVPSSPAPTLKPTPEPTPEPVPTPQFAPIELSGAGDKIPKFEIPEGAAAIATITNKGTSNFAVWSLAADGSKQKLLVNVIGNYHGTVLLDLDELSVAFEVTSNGSWSISVKPISAALAWDISTALAGKGDDVVLLQPSTNGFVTMNVTHKGASNFAVWSYSVSAGADLLVNEIGNYSGEVLLSDGTVFLEITADGSWNLGVPQ